MFKNVKTVGAQRVPPCQPGCCELKQMEFNKVISTVFPPVMRVDETGDGGWLNERLLHLHVLMPGAEVDLIW